MHQLSYSHRHKRITFYALHFPFSRLTPPFFAMSTPLLLDTRSLPSPVPTVINTVGALYVGWGLSAALFGMMCMQAWTYFTRYQNDTAFNKLLVSPSR